MPRVAKGHVEQLPSGSFRAVVYAGIDPITRRPLYLKSTAKTEDLAQVELGKLIARASDGRRPESARTVSELIDQYAEIAEWDLSTRTSNGNHIRRVIKPALGHMEIRKIRGPVLDLLYARLKRCSDLACTGKPFTEHRNVPCLEVDPADSRPAWKQVADAVRDAISAGTPGPGEPLPSVREMHELQGVRTATLQHALSALAEAGLVVVRQGRTAVVAGDADASVTASRARRPGHDHDCKRSGCRAHVCSPMKPKTIRNIHSILSGAFGAAQRWEWVDRNPAESARPPTVSHAKRPATPPTDVAAVIAEGRRVRPALALYVWLVAITGVRRGELCGLQVRDVDLGNGVVHIAFNYVVSNGRRIRKDTKTHQDRHLAIDPVTCALIREHLDAVRSALAGAGLQLPDHAYLFSNDPMSATPWNPDWATHKVSDLAAAARVKLDIKGLRHYTASQLLAARFDLQNTAARLGHGGGGATTLRHYADPVSEVDQRASAYMAQLTAGGGSGQDA
jgi:integrase